MHRFLARSCLLAFVLLIAAVAPAHALDLRGAVTVREQFTSTDGDTRDVTVRWDLSGTPVAVGGGLRTTATPTVVSFSDRDSCGATDSFAGFVTNSTNPTTSPMSFSITHVDQLSGWARGALRFPEFGAHPLATITSTSCDGAPFEQPDQWSLVQNPNLEINSQPAVVIGLGNLDLTNADGSTTTMVPTSYLMPGSIRMRRISGVWRSSGTLTRTGEYFAAIRGIGQKTVTVSWSLRSYRPSTTCRVPPARLVRGRTITWARGMLRRAGLQPGRLVPVNVRGVARGRVVGYSHPFVARCGTRVAIRYQR